MQNKINLLYPAKNLTKNIKKICRSCDTYIRNKSRGYSKLGLMSYLGPASKPSEIIPRFWRFKINKKLSLHLSENISLSVSRAPHKIRIYFNLKNSKCKWFYKTGKQHIRYRWNWDDSHRSLLKNKFERIQEIFR